MRTCAVKVLILDIAALMRHQNDLGSLVGELFDCRRAGLDALCALEGVCRLVDRLIHVNTAQDSLARDIKFIYCMNSKFHIVSF